MGYKSPIKLLCDDMMHSIEIKVREHNEMQIMAAVNQVVSVDKEELIKALNYDRHQYEKGYADAKAEFQRPTSEWVLDSDNLPVCKECGEVALQRIFVKMPHLIQDVRMVHSNYCPHCGAKMVSSENN